VTESDRQEVPDLGAAHAMLGALADLETDVVESAEGISVLGYVGGRNVRILVKRDLDDAAEGDLRFVGGALADMRRLVEAVRMGERLSGEEIGLIDSRVRGASAAPWTAFIESDGGQGGCDVIRVTDQDDQPDMYLWFDNDLAPSAFFRLVAAARQAIPRLLELVR
jgi:hypothetical protein